jgi:hypothetical protein
LAFLLFVFLVVLALSGAIAGINLWQAFRFVLSIGALGYIVVDDSILGISLVVVEAYQKPGVLST